MITEAKNCLKEVIEAKLTQIKKVCFSATEERNTVTNRTFPFVSMISKSGSFDNTKTRQTGRQLADGSVVSVLIRGERTVDIVLRFWCTTIDEAESYVDTILPFIPTRFTFGLSVGLVSIVSTDLSDFTSNATKQAVSAIVVRFVADYAADL